MAAPTKQRVRTLKEGLRLKRRWAGENKIQGLNMRYIPGGPTGQENVERDGAIVGVLEVSRDGTRTRRQPRTYHLFLVKDAAGEWEGYFIDENDEVGVKADHVAVTGYNGRSRKATLEEGSLVLIGYAILATGVLIGGAVTAYGSYKYYSILRDAAKFTAEY